MILLKLVILTLMAGLAMPFGALLATAEGVRPYWLQSEFRHSVIAFGGGALLSAVALVLVPEGVQRVDTLTMAVCFSAGGVVFMLIDILLDRMKGSMSQLIAMLADFIPESLALGAAFATQQATALLLAMMVAIQNIPEGFNAFRELKEQGDLSPKLIIGSFTTMALLGPLCGLIGHFALGSNDYALGSVMLFAAGGILYLVFQDIAPQAKLEKRWGPTLGAVLGFLLGLLGQALTQG